MEFLTNPKKYRWVAKARQVGFSFLFACEAIARCHLRDGHTSVFVSYNLDDAKEKINYARQLHEELPLAYQKRLVVDSKTELGFEANGSSKRVSRIVSNPSKAPRGKKGDLYLDELAHYANDREVYKGSTALILRSRGQLTGCSSPLGRRGVFWDVSEQEIRRYPAYSRQRVPWWLCRFFSNDVKQAAREAPSMSTEERVRAFGLQGIQDQFDSLLLEDFQQEFELVFCDESYSFFPYDLILPCTTDELVVYDDFQAFPDPIEGRLTAGFDVCRKRDLSELVIVEEIDGKQHLRLWRSYDQVPFAEQEADLARMMEVLPIARLSIDQSGIGMHLAENLRRRYETYIRPENFTNQAKEIWCNDFRILLQRKAVVMPKDRELVASLLLGQSELRRRANGRREQGTRGSLLGAGARLPEGALCHCGTRDRCRSEGARMNQATQTHGQAKDKPTIEKVNELLKQLMKDRFFGEVGITFQNGRPHTIKVHRTYKVEQL